MADWCYPNTGYQTMESITAMARRTGAVLLMIVAGGNAVATEQPGYEVLEERDGYEIRRYTPYIVAETVVEGDFKDAGNEAFRILAGYIFGDNKSDETMNMTAPVESRQASDGVKMNMTAPVTSQRASGEPDRYAYRFVMESRYTLETLPQPNDSRVTLREVGARTVAVNRYSGLWTQSNYAKHEQELLRALRRNGVEIVGDPLLARYNGPFTPWFLRRNEVMVEVDWPGSGEK